MSDESSRFIKTWKQFRDMVEKRLAEEGMNENVKIDYIDFSCCSIDVEVCFDKNAGDMAIH